MTTAADTKHGDGGRPVLDQPRPDAERLLVGMFTMIPMLALAAAVPLAWGWGLGWLDIGLAIGFYYLTGFGVTVGYHRYFTHRAFKANRALRNGLAIAGSLALQGDVITWIADHRRHHAFADKEGDPHSPWLFGTSAGALAKGFLHAHIGWLFARERTNAQRFTPDLLADRDIVRISRLFPLLDGAEPARARAASAGWSRCRCGAPSPRSSGRGSCASGCCTTSPGRSTRSAT